MVSLQLGVCINIYTINQYFACSNHICFEYYLERDDNVLYVYSFLLFSQHLLQCLQIPKFGLDSQHCVAFTAASSISSATIVFKSFPLTLGYGKNWITMFSYLSMKIFIRLFIDGVLPIA